MRSLVSFKRIDGKIRSVIEFYRKGPAQNVTVTIGNQTIELQDDTLEIVLEPGQYFVVMKWMDPAGNHYSAAAFLGVPALEEEKERELSFANLFAFLIIVVMVAIFVLISVLTISAITLLRKGS